MRDEWFSGSRCRCGSSRLWLCRKRSEETRRREEERPAGRLTGKKTKFSCVDFSDCSFSGIDRGFHQVGLGIAAFEQTVEPFSFPKPFHGPELVGNFLEVSLRDGVPYGAHFPAAISVHRRAAIEHE